VFLFVYFRINFYLCKQLELTFFALPYGLILTFLHLRNLKFKIFDFFKLFDVQMLRKYIDVKTTSKYKEDDFSDPNAVAFSQDACVHKIHFRREVHTCNPRSFFPRLTPL